MISFVKLRILEPDDNFSLRGATLRKAMEEDKKNGLLPFFVSVTVGTTSCCSVDNVEEIGPICEEFDAWLHVDAAYAGSAMICPEFRPLFKGVEKASSLNTNPNKWMLTNFDCSCYWVKDRFKLTQALTVDPLYLKHNFDQKSIDYRHWGVPLSRRFRSLKLWFVIRMYGVEGLRKYIREHCRLAKIFENLVRGDARFEVMNKVQMGLVCFRMKGSNGLNQKLLSLINASGKLHMVPASLNDRYVIRFCVCRETATEDDMEYAWNVIKEYAQDVSILYKDQDMQVPPSPTDSTSDENRRPSKEIEELYRAMETGKRFSLARSTSTISEVVQRASVDLDEDDCLQPRSRRGSLFPVSSFVDDFAAGCDPRGRSASLAFIPIAEACGEGSEDCQKSENPHK
jgi:aromatic-L-amino-acid decarboxylase